MTACPVPIGAELAAVLAEVAQGRIGVQVYLARAGLVAPALTRGQLDAALDVQIEALAERLAHLRGVCGAGPGRSEPGSPAPGWAVPVTLSPRVSAALSGSRRGHR